MAGCWEKPVLIVLAKGKPEEALVQSCKILAFTGPNSTPDCIDPPAAPCADLVQS
jgi:hypothetical protein